jgi:type VI secretion system protein ImpG
MRDDLLHYYERELTFLRQSGAEFARRYPKVAGRLQLEPTKCDDPHVERLLEGFAFLAARVHLKIDDDFPELSEALLSLLYPAHVRPLPALSLARFELDPEQGKLSTGFHIPRGTALYSPPVQGAPCRFRTCYDTTLWPVEVEDAAWTVPQALDPPVRAMDAPAAVRLLLRCAPDLSFRELDLDTLRLHVRAESALASTLYELLLNNTMEILVREPGGGGGSLRLPAASLRPVGFGEDETLLPPPRRSFIGYSYLQDYFAFPEKYFFLDLGGLDRLRDAGFGSRAEVVFLLSSFERQERRQILEPGVGPETFQLGCTPVVNLFEKVSEPILLHQRRPEYPLVADARRRATTGVYSVDEVSVVSPDATRPIRFAPFHSHRHTVADQGDTAFWIARRRPAHLRGDDATDVSLSFVELSGRTLHPDADAATARLTCFNGDLPSRLPFGSGEAGLEMPGGGPVARVVPLTKPTQAVEPPLGRPRLWRLLSQLSLNFVSLVDEGADALRETLRLHNVADSMVGEQQIRGLESVGTAPTYARIDSDQGLAFARGHRVELTFDEERFAGGGVYLLASVLDRFLGLYVSLNSFNVLSVQTRQRQRPLAEWPPRSGWKTLL